MSGNRRETTIEHTANVLIILVHGTFARGAEWARDGSYLRRRLHELIDGSSGNIEFVEFEWTGKNGHRARHHAAKKLALEIVAIRDASCYDHVFVIAHSHGGNIALFSQSFLVPEDQVDGIITLSTPFLTVKLRPEYEGTGFENLVNSGKFGFLQTVFVLFIAMLFSVYAIMFGSFLAGEYGEGVGLLVILLSTPLGWSLFFGLREFLAETFFRFSAQRSAIKFVDAFSVPELPRTHFVSFNSRGDEASFLLNTLSKPGHFVVKLLDRLRLSRHLALVKFPVGGLLATTCYFMLFLLVTGTDSRSEDVWPGLGGELPLWGFFQFFLIPALVWFIISMIANGLNFLRSHPAGFGWERPLLNSFVTIGTSPIAPLDTVASYIHIEPDLNSGNKIVGLRHSWLYQDGNTVGMIADWIHEVVSDSEPMSIGEGKSHIH